VRLLIANKKPPLKKSKTMGTTGVINEGGQREGGCAWFEGRRREGEKEVTSAGGLLRSKQTVLQLISKTQSLQSPGTGVGRKKGN